MKQSQCTFTNWEAACETSQVSACGNFKKGQEAHVWKVVLRGSYESHYLSPEEQKRASQFRLFRDQNRYIGSRVMLRHILSLYMNCNPAIISLDQGKYGKPFIKGERDLKFNMTYSGNIVCYIVSTGSDVGIDLEYVDPRFEWFGIANLYFTMKEVDDLKCLSYGKQIREFFKLWTQKEALLKAEGLGLSGIEKINKVACDDMKMKYLLTSFHCGEDYQGAIATDPKVSSFRYFHTVR